MQTYTVPLKTEESIGHKYPVVETAFQTCNIRAMVDSMPAAPYIYKAKHCKLLAVLTHAQKTKFTF